MVNSLTMPGCWGLLLRRRGLEPYGEERLWAVSCDAARQPARKSRKAGTEFSLHSPQEVEEQEFVHREKDS